MATLEVTGLGISFGGLRAVDDLTMSIEKGGLVGLIGPNGAGKLCASCCKAFFRAFQRF